MIINRLILSGTYEKIEDEEPEVYEVVNIQKLKAFVPNIRVVNLWGVSGRNQLDPYKLAMISPTFRLFT